MPHTNSKIEQRIAKYEIYLKKYRAIPVLLVATSDHEGSLDILVDAEKTLTTKQLYEIIKTVNTVLLSRVADNG